MRAVRRFCLGNSLLVLCILGCERRPPVAPAIQAASEAQAYDFAPLAFLGDPAPKGGEFTFDFEPSSVNNSGAVSFAADVTTGGEGVFVDRRGELTEIARSGDAAPGGGTFSPFGALFGSDAPINDRGDISFAFTLTPFSLPLGVNTGLYRFSHATGTVEAVVVPEVTPAPGGGVFAGTAGALINNHGDIAFEAVLHGADIAPGPPGVEGLGLGMGGAVADRNGRISSLVSPGDLAPGGGIFDFAEVLSINDHGDVTFNAHIDGDECLALSSRGQGRRIGCLGSAFVKEAATGQIRLLARQGGPAPGGGTCRGATRSLVNNQGQIVFGCDMGSAGEPLFERMGMFFRADGVTIPIVRPGDPMPGGGSNLRAGAGNLVHLNDAGDVTFAARLETGEDGLYVWSRGSLGLVARTGTVIPGVGTIVGVVPPDLVGTQRFPWEGIGANDLGQVLFTAAVDDGSGTLRGVLVLATPRRTT